MKKIISTMLMITFIGIASMTIGAKVSPSEKEAILVFNETQYDFGKVQQGETSFWI